MGQYKIHLLVVTLIQKNIYNIIEQGGICMTITVENTNNKEILSDISVTHSLIDDESYKLCVKADALRLANMQQESISKYLRAIFINRNNIDAYYGLALSHKELKNYDKAIEILEKAIQIKDDDFALFYELGICHLMNGTPCPAIKCLIRSIQLNPDNLNAQVQLALAHELVGEEELALMIYQRIIEVAPDFLKAYKHKAALLMSLDEYKDASTVFNEILKVKPGYTKAFLGIGICFDKLKKTVSAMRYYKKFIEQKPNSSHAPFVENRLFNLKNKRSNKTTNRPFSLVTNPMNA